MTGKLCLPRGKLSLQNNIVYIIVKLKYMYREEEYIYMNKKEFFKNLEEIGFFKATKDQLFARGWTSSLFNCQMHFYDFEDNKNYLACWVNVYDRPKSNIVFLNLLDDSTIRESRAIQKKTFEDYDEAWEYLND